MNKIDIIQFREIPFIENYFINPSGIVIDNNGKGVEYKIDENNDVFILIVDKYIRLDSLVLLTFCGYTRLPIIHYKGNINCESRYIDYDLSYTKIIEEKNSIFINDIEFKQIQEFPNYYISNNCIVYSKFNNKLLKRTYSNNGYIRYSFNNEIYKGIKKYAHRILYETWVGNIPEDFVIDHKDGHKWNTCVDNLEAVTRQENNIRAYMLELRPNVIEYSNNEIRDICRLLQDGSDTSDIYEYFGAYSNKERQNIMMLVHRLRKGNYRKYITNDYNIPKSDEIKYESKYSEDIIRKIKKLINDGLGDTEISRILNIPRQTIHVIRVDKVACYRKII